MAPDDEATRTHVPLTGGTMVSHYRIISKIGAGGMGEVYLAEDTELNRKVALKFLPSHLCQDPECRARFKREAQAAAKLSHPNIVTIFEVGEFQGRPFFAMEYVEGQSLHQLAHDRPLPPDTMIDYATQICQAIAEAHRAGVIHRDVKTSNILVDAKGRARLLDFGLAAVAGDEKLTKTGSTLGTVSYMSPEQVSGREIDGRSDLFSLGIVLYELVTGRSPFRRDSEGATLRAIMQDVPEPLSRYKSEVPPRLQQIVDKLLEKDRELRYQTAEDVIADLKRLSYDSQHTPEHRRPRPTRSKTRLMVGVAGVAMVALAAAIFFRVRSRAPVATGHALPMIAVLPFENLGDPQDKYFADGMTTEIISRLGEIDGLGVISRTSAMRYENSGKSVTQIGKELGVDYVLEGAVRWEKTGEQARVRITPELIRAFDNRHLWSDNYEREIIGVFAVQEDIAAKITGELGVKLLEPARKSLAARPTTNVRAYDYYLKGLNGLRQYYYKDPALRVAAAYLDSAVWLDSSFALAYAYRSWAYSWLAFWSVTPELRRIARESFERALQLEPSLSYGHLAAGIYYNLVESNYDRAMSELELAYSELRGNADMAYHIALVQFRLGRYEEADENFQKAVDLDPLNFFLHAARCEAFWFRRMWADADEAITRAIALEPSRPELYANKMGLYISRYGDWRKIREVVPEALRHVADTASLVNYLLLNWQTWGYPADSLFAGSGLQLGSVLDLIRNDRELNSEMYQQYWVLSEGYGAAGNATLAAEYLDSTCAELRTQLLLAESDPQHERYPDYAHRTSYLGLVLADQGHCQEAEALGERGKELLSINKCHW